MENTTQLNRRHWLRATGAALAGHGRDALLAMLKQHGCRYAEPQGNFVFFRTGMPIETFQQRMRRENLIVARAFPPLVEWCRISVGTPDEMAVAHAALQKVLAA